MQHVSMVVTDFDGTLLNSSGKVSDSDIATLWELGKRGVVRVIATGRSPYSFEKVIKQDFPIDYLIFSSGAGAMHWSSKEILYTTEINVQEVQSVVEELIAHSVDFMVHEPIPANHRFLYHYTGSVNSDFLKRIEIYSPFCRPFIPGVVFDTPASQIIAVLPHDVGWFESLKSQFPSVKVIRTTSPLDGRSIWMEIFARNISKAYGIEWLCRELEIGISEVVAVGNDYNDLDMLNFVERSYVVENSPADLCKRFETVRTNNDSGFTHAVEMALG
jgi:hypothetical protein